MRVVFPAPFGPRNPKATPAGTTRSTPSTAARSPNFFVSPRVSITASTADSLDADHDGHVRRRQQVTDRLRAASAGHVERSPEAACRNEAELPRRLRVTAAGDDHRTEPVSRRVAGAPL